MHRRPLRGSRALASGPVTAAVGLGLLLALCCAVIALLGFLFKLRGAAEAPAIEWRRPVGSTAELFRHRWWTLGVLVAMGAWVFHVAALALAPISLVQSVIAGGLVLLTPMADRIFGVTVRRRDWIGVAIAAIGLAMLAATLGNGAKSSHNDYEVGTLVIYVSALAAGAIGFCVAVTGDRGPRPGPVLALAAGLLWGASDVVIKAKSGSLGDDGLLVVISPEAAAILVLSLVGLVVSARSLQLGPPVSVIALTTLAANLATIAAGSVVFGEPLPDSDGALVVRVLAFAAIVVGATLVPGPAPPEALEPKASAAPATAAR
jgi:drug/metabolite transporter (DMT)-like permease